MTVKQQLAAAKRESIRQSALRFFVAQGIVGTVTEHRFANDRKWRFDYAWPEAKVALEVEGGVWTGGRHTSGAGFMADMAKYNRAVCDGWRVVRCVPSTLKTPETALMLRKLLVP